MSRDRCIPRAGLLALAVVSLPVWVQAARADVKLPAIFTPHMVLQRDMKDKVWGWADPGEKIMVSIAGQSQTVEAGPDGKWNVLLDPLKAGGPHTLTVKGKNTIDLDDVLVGEVWICSGQSNMEMSVGGSTDGDLEPLGANFPKIRLISVPKVGTQEPQYDFKGKWEVCTPATARDFSAVGYYFGRQLYQTLGVPIGLIDDSWGGSACEAWVRRDLLASDSKYGDLMAQWEKTEADAPKAREEYEKRLAAYSETVSKLKAEGKAAPRPPQSPDAQLKGNSRPGNLYNGVLKPTIGYGIRGAIWYQGESNAGRAYQYRDLFPLMIQSWRDEWGIGPFSFYWAQLADYQNEPKEPVESAWAELREAQTMTMKRLPNTGQAVIIDIGEGKDIHPRDKQNVGKRLARWALARDYGLKVACESPIYKSMEKKDGKLVVSFDHVGSGLRPFDVSEVKGFAIAGSDRKFVWAKAKLVGKDKVEVWAEGVSDPQAVRYGWADNPVCNLFANGDLPVTPFRSDDWPARTAPKR
jgi:sialate O-acetylesterase